MNSSVSLPDTKEKRSLWMTLAGVLLFAPLFRAGNRPLPLMILELAALVLLVLYWIHRSGPRELSVAETALVGCILLLPLLQLIPLPPAFWAEVLPGRAFYAEGLRRALGDTAFSEDWRPLALVPHAAESAWLALLPPVAVFIATRSLPGRQLPRLIYLFLGMAVFQAVLGLIQYGAGPGSVFRLGNEHWSGASGTYASRNHLAGLLEMALPVALALLIGTLGKRSGPSYGRRGRRQRFLFWGTRQGSRSMLYAAATLVILLGLVFTRSRTGIVLAMVGLFLCLVVFVRRASTEKVYGPVGTLAFSAVILAFMVGLAPVFSRFALLADLENARWTIYAGTLRGIAEFFPLGSGSGSFREVFHRFHPDGLAGGAVYHAHNDYLEWIFVAGLPALALIAAGFFIYSRQWLRVWRGKQDSLFHYMQIGAGLGLLLLLLHTLVSFHFHIPANAVYFAFLSGVFFCPIQAQRHRQRRESAPPRTEYKPLRSREIPPENRVNPFAD